MLGILQLLSLALGAANLPPPARQWLGIRYAAPPTGELRFAPAQLLPYVHNASAKAYASFGNICWQDPAPLKKFAPLDRVTMDEDCLFLNVFAPASPTPSLLPVMVWIHGGAFVAGYSQQYDMRRLARQRGVVVVSINYRLGALGFLAHPELAKEDVEGHATGGMNGVRDQVTALRWVQQNIARFGGDPKRVTIFGESAGGLSVCYLLASAPAKRLFQRGIIGSGPCVGPWGPPFGKHEAPAVATLTYPLMRAVGADSLAALRRVNASDLMLRHHGNAWDVSTDGYITDGNLSRRIAAADLNVADVMVGSTSVDSLLMPPWNNGAWMPSSALEYDVAVRALFAASPATGTAVLERYPATRGSTPQQSWQQISADVCVVCPTRHLALALSSATKGPAAPAVYYYRYEGPSKAGRAGHASELCELFVDDDTGGSRHNCSSMFAEPFDAALADAMAQYWTSFARDGAPSFVPPPSALRAAHAPAQWPRCDGGKACSVMLLDNSSHVAALPARVQSDCDFWASVGPITSEVACVLPSLAALVPH